MHQHWHYHKLVEGADPFLPHQFETKQVAISQNSIPKIFISPEAYANMLTIAQLSGSDEIGWLGSVRTIADYQFLIDKIFLVKQVVHGSTTEMTEDGLSDLFTDLAMEDPELCSRILFWGHVHPSNSTEPSSQDEDQMKLFNHNDWFIRGIFGRSGRAEFSLFDYKRGVIWKDIPWQIHVVIDEDRKEAWKAEIAEKVSQVVVTHTMIKPILHHGITPGEDDDSEASVRLLNWRDRVSHGMRGNRRAHARFHKSVILSASEEDFPGDHLGGSILSPLHQDQGFIEDDD